jgi:nickel/cobalt exporter
MRRLVQSVILVACLLVLGSLSAEAADPFQSGRPSNASTVLATPAWMSGAIAAVARAQSELNDTISVRIRTLNQTHSARDLAMILILSFVFGVFHAAGPGHGKMVVASYLMARRERLLSGIVVGSIISFVQGVSAIVIVGVLALVLQLGQLQVLDRTTPVEVVSYALIALIGLWMFYQAVTGRGHDHHHHGAAGEHGHHHGHDHHVKPPRRRPGNMIGLAVAAGLVPCASAIIVMLFALANHAFVIGIEAALAMSLGMAITVSSIGLASVFARQLMERTVAANSRGGATLERGLNLGGSLLLVVFAGLLLLGAWSRL